MPTMKRLLGAGVLSGSLLATTVGSALAHSSIYTVKLTCVAVADGDRQSETVTRRVVADDDSQIVEASCSAVAVAGGARARSSSRVVINVHLE